ncbi:hypothetical protein D9757_009327 [Collybiopsis confluens]|uniref:FAD dependent oxidoreductase domain-containing protein n=1 Tax=Collybiopsis confluens TaxID=2823264 RepID=A0A8H5H3U7_9AGAR|nr:hypothetical protein D9757_009327 [Collybiopsis confluens]
MSNTKHVVILGAAHTGVAGLTTAISILDKANRSPSSAKYSVIVLASQLPTDPKSIGYTSHWAGAHHVSHATGTGNSPIILVSSSIDFWRYWIARTAVDGNSDSNSSEHPEQLAIDQETFNTMWALSEPGNEAEICFLRIEQVEYYQEEIPEGKEHHLRWYPNFRILLPESLTPDLRSQGVRSGVSLSTLTIDTPVYLSYLFERLEKAGGKVIKGHVDHIRDVETQINYLLQAQGTNSIYVDAIINCTGLGARTLGGVEDSNVYALRGQTVVLRAPWIRFGRTISSGDDLWTYIIPRRSGDVVVGGTKVADDYHPSPRPEITLDILTRGLKLCPEFVEVDPPIVTTTNMRFSHDESELDSESITLDDLLEQIKPIMVEEGCGLRPARRGGVRIERGDVEIDSVDGSSGKKVHKKTVPIIHNYGHSGSGYQSSWGSSNRAVRLLEEAIAS